MRSRLDEVSRKGAKTQSLAKNQSWQGSTGEFMPWHLAAQAGHGTVAADDVEHFKHRWTHGLAGEHRARSVDEETGLDAGFICESPQGFFGGGGIERLHVFQAVSQRRQ